MKREILPFVQNDNGEVQNANGARNDRDARGHNRERCRPFCPSRKAPRLSFPQAPVCHFRKCPFCHSRKFLAGIHPQRESRGEGGREEKGCWMPDYHCRA